MYELSEEAKSIIALYNEEEEIMKETSVVGLNEFLSICRMNKDTLKRHLEKELKGAGYAEVINEDGFLYARGEMPVLLTAHMDTVHKTTCQKVSMAYDDKKRLILSSPQGIGGDDRCGIYEILQVIKTMKPYVLFCEDEEIGGVGSEKFCNTNYIDELDSLNYLMELDRMNAKDAVFYDCDNPEFTEWIEENTGFKEAYGSFSDISNLAPMCGIAAVNLSCGYYKAHTTDEYVVWEEMLHAIDVVKNLLLVVPDKPFEYIECKHMYNYYGGYFGNTYKNYNTSNNTGSTKSKYNYGYYDDEMYEAGYEVGYEEGRTSGYKMGYDACLNDHNISESSTEFVVNYEENSEPKVEKTVGASVYEALGKFFIENPTLSYRDIIDVYNK